MNCLHGGSSLSKLPLNQHKPISISGPAAAAGLFAFLFIICDFCNTLGKETIYCKILYVGRFNQIFCGCINN